MLRRSTPEMPVNPSPSVSHAQRVRRGEPFSRSGRQTGKGSWMARKMARTGVATMLIVRVLSALAAIALGAAVMLAMPGFSPEVEARTPPAAVKGDRLDRHPIGQDCSERAWPYYEPNCLRDLSRPNGKARNVRVVTTDRIGR
jgi:hypothetical protein